MPDIFAIHLNNLSFKRYKTTKDVPMDVGDNADYALAEHVGEMSGLTMDELVRFWNKYVPKAHRVTRFKDRLTAGERCFNLMAEGYQPPQEEDETMAKAKKKTSKKGKKKASKKTTKKTTKKAAKKTGGKRGRSSVYDGATIKPAASLKGENPRRDGTHGHKSMAIVLKNPKGISYEDYLSKGGRRNDLVWDEGNENVTIRYKS